MNLATGQRHPWHVPAQVVTLQRVGKTGRVIATQDHLGGVFASISGKMLRPAYSLGPAGAKQGTVQNVMLTCPVSAVPDEVWQVLNLWNMCRLTRTLPVAGGLLDQPMVVQRCFPLLDAEFRKADSGSRSSPEQAAMLAVGTMMKALGSK